MVTEGIKKQVEEGTQSVRRGSSFSKQGLGAQD